MAEVVKINEAKRSAEKISMRRRTMTMTYEHAGSLGDFVCYAFRGGGTGRMHSIHASGRQTAIAGIGSIRCGRRWGKRSKKNGKRVDKTLMARTWNGFAPKCSAVSIPAVSASGFCMV